MAEINKKFAEKWMAHYGELLGAIPSITCLWECAQEAVLNNDEKKIKNYEKLIYLIHNSVVSPYCKIGKNVKFGYGGIAVVMHKNAVIGDNVAVGQGVTIGGTPGGKNKVRTSKISVPTIRDNVYISAGAKILGPIIIGEYSIIGANAVVLTDVPPYTIYGGMPAKKIKTLDKENCLEYRSLYHGLSDIGADEFVGIFPEKM